MAEVPSAAKKWQRCPQQPNNGRGALSCQTMAEVPSAAKQWQRCPQLPNNGRGALSCQTMAEVPSAADPPTLLLLRKAASELMPLAPIGKTVRMSGIKKQRHCIEPGFLSLSTLVPCICLYLSALCSSDYFNHIHSGRLKKFFYLYLC